MNGVVEAHRILGSTDDGVARTLIDESGREIVLFND